MVEFELSKDATELLVSKIKRYFLDEFDYDIGGFEAEFLIEFFAREIGPHCYNSGLADAHTLFTDKSEELSYLIQELEKSTP